MSDRYKMQEYVPLNRLTTLKIGGIARYLIEITEPDQFRPALKWVNDHHLPLIVMAGGSNILVADHDYNGVVILVRNKQLSWKSSHLMVGAGAPLGQLIGRALEKGYGGLSWLIGVPGTVGGAIYGNAGRQTDGLGQYVDHVESIDYSGRMRSRVKTECEFAYRHSIFKNKKEIIISAELVLPGVDPAQEGRLLASAAAKKRSTQPITAATAGCVFKNPSVDAEKLPAELRPEVDNDGTIAAWRLIAAADLTGYTMGGIQISTQHANFMVNTGSGTADQMMQLISYVKQQIRDRYGVQLQEEIQYLGFN